MYIGCTFVHCTFVRCTFVHWLHVCALLTARLCNLSDIKPGSAQNCLKTIISKQNKMKLFQQKFAPPDTGQWYSIQPLNFRPKIACKRDTANPPIQFTAEQAANHVASRCEQPNCMYYRHFCQPLDEALLWLCRYGQPNCTLLEALLSTTRVKPYFDFEMYLDEEPDTEEIYQLKVLPPIMRSLEVEPEDVRAASRHGWVKTKDGRKFKVSFRAFVLGKWLHVSEMNTIINTGEFDEPGWDKGVYSFRGERMMAVVGGVKGKGGDVRVLEPVKEGFSYHEYLIQALDGNEQAMDVQPPKGATKTPRREIHSVDAALGHVPRKPSWLTLMDESMLELASDYMVAAGMKNFRLGMVSGNTVAILNEPGTLRWCMHKEAHKSNNASVLFYKNKKVMYLCYSSKCFDEEPKEIGTWDTILPYNLDDISEDHESQQGAGRSDGQRQQGGLGAGIHEPVRCLFWKSDRMTPDRS